MTISIEVAYSVQNKIKISNNFLQIVHYMTTTSDDVTLLRIRLSTIVNKKLLLYMTNLRLTLEGLLKKPVVWFRDHSSLYYRCVYLGTELLLTEDDLNKIDGRLQTAIDYALPRNTAPIAGALIQTTVRSWYEKSNAFWTKHDGELYYMGRIVSIESQDNEKQTVMLTATRLLGKNVDGVMVLTGKEYKNTKEHSFAWMEEYFPTSTKRLWAGSELGLTKADLAEYVFYPPSSTQGTVEMPADF